MKVVLAVVIAVTGAACRRHVDASSGAATPEGAVRGALEAANHGEDPSAFLLDGSRCRALYASKDAPQVTERGRASDEASCEQSATMLRDALRRLPKGHVRFSVGVPKADPFVGTSVPVTVQVDTDAFAPTTQWYALRVNGRYFAAKKVDAPVAGPPSGSVVVPEPQQAPRRMTVAELRRALSSSANEVKAGDFVVIDGEYMGTDGDTDGHERVGIVEDATAQHVELTVSCVDPGLPPEVRPGKKLTASGVFRRDDDSKTSATLDPCFIK